jgi:hypothetical protein
MAQDGVDAAGMAATVVRRNSGPTQDKEGTDAALP